MKQPGSSREKVRIVAVAAALATVLVGARAGAQDAPPEPPPPPTLPSGFGQPHPSPAPPPPPPSPFDPAAPSVEPPPGAFPPPGAAPGPGGFPPPAAEHGDKDKEKDKDEVKDGVRARGGFNIGGGVMMLPNDGASPIGPAIALNGRIGIQLNHYFGLVYQNTPIITFTAQQSSGLKAGFADYNSFLLMITLGDFFDIGVGPSVDFLMVYNASVSVGLGGVTPQQSSSSGVNAGAHGRVAFNIGGLSGNGPRRSGFNLGIDFHPLFTGQFRGFSATAGFGAEWY